jgi:hypothetical protein
VTDADDSESLREEEGIMVIGVGFRTGPLLRVVLGE